MPTTNRNYSPFLWVELTGFDNTAPDYAVGHFLDNAGLIPDAVSFLISNPEFVHIHDGVLDDRVLPFDCAAYGGHPTGYERARQDWTRAQVKGLVDELHRHGVAVYLSTFEFYAEAPWAGGHPEVTTVLNDGQRSGNICLFKHLSDGTLYEDFFVDRLAATLRDYGFDGYHQADGYCHPRFPLFRADYSADLTAQFLAHTPVALPDALGPDAGDDPVIVQQRSAWIWRHARGEWIRFCTDRMTGFCTKVIHAVHGVGARVVLNNALTRDPFQAIYRHGVDYQRIAAAGADGFIAETVAPGIILGGESGLLADSDPHYDLQAMLTLMAAAVPSTTLRCLNGVHDVNEQWDVLRHGPALLEREIHCQTSLFHAEPDGSLRRCVAGPVVCLSDGLRAHEWQWLRDWWELGYGETPARVRGATLLWSDAAHAAQLDDYLETRRLSTHKLLYELISRGAPVHCVATTAAVQRLSGPALILNAHLWPREELDVVLAYQGGPLMLIGDLSDDLPPAPLRFADCYAPGALQCAVYGIEAAPAPAITGEPEVLPEDVWGLPEPPFYFNELYFRRVSDAFLHACTERLLEVSRATTVTQRADVITVRALEMAPGCLRLLVANSSHFYAICQVDAHDPIASARIMGDFPRHPPAVDGSRVGIRVPGGGMVVLDVTLSS